MPHGYYLTSYNRYCLQIALLHCLVSAIAVLISWILDRLLRNSKFAPIFARQVLRPWFIFALGALLNLLVSFVYLQGYPNSADEFCYLFQAANFRDGVVTAQWGTGMEPFLNNHMSLYDGRVLTSFFPGWSILLGYATRFGVPSWAVNPVLGAALLVFLYQFAKTRYSSSVALWTVAILATSPYFILTSASLFPHSLAALSLLAVVFASVRYQSEGKIIYLFILVGSLAIGMTTRPFTLIAGMLPICLWAIFRRSKRLLVAYAAIGFLVVAISCLYNTVTVGDPFTFPYITIYLKKNFLAVFELSHKSLRITRIRFGTLFAWVSPLFILLYFYRAGQSVIKRSPDVINWIFLSLVIVYCFFPYPGGNEYGPRYYYEGYPFLVLSAVVLLLTEKSVFSLLSISTRKILLSLTILCNLVLTQVIAINVGKTIDMRKSMHRYVEQRDVHNAIIFVRPMRGVRTVYANFDIADLIMNDPKLNNDVLYALVPTARIEDICKFKERFPSRSFYRLIADPDPNFIEMWEVCRTPGSFEAT